MKQIANVKVPQGAVYAVAFRPGGKTLAAAGSDGKVRLINPENGSLIKEFAPVTITPRAVVQNIIATAIAPQARRPGRTRDFPQRRKPYVTGDRAQGNTLERTVCL